MTTRDAFERLVADTDYPMFVVTAATSGRRAGCLVGFVTQASIEPPRLLVLISKANHTFDIAAHTTTLVVHFLHEGNHGLAELFGELTGDHTDKFEACDWDEGPDATPVLAGTRGWVAGRILARLDAGDHVAHLLEVVEAELVRPGPQLGFQALRDVRPGHPA